LLSLWRTRLPAPHVLRHGDAGAASEHSGCIGIRGRGIRESGVEHDLVTTELFADDFIVILIELDFFRRARTWPAPSYVQRLVAAPRRAGPCAGAVPPAARANNVANCVSTELLPRPRAAALGREVCANRPSAGTRCVLLRVHFERAGLQLGIRAQFASASDCSNHAA